MNNKKHLISGFILLLFLSILFVVSLLGITNNYRIPILDSRDLNEGWYHVISDDNEIPLETLPTRLDIYNDETYTIRMSLPFNFNRSQKILIRTSLANLMVHLDDVLLYEASFKAENTYASTWHVIEVPQASEGKFLSLTFDTPYASMRGILNEISFGDRGMLIASMFREFGMRLAIGLLTFFIGLSLLMISIVLRKENYHTIYLGVSAIIFSFWLISESRMLQLIIGNPNILGGLSYIAIALSPVTLALYIGHSLITDYKKFYDIAAIIFFINTLSVIALHYSGLASFFETVPVSIILLICGLIATLLFFILEYKKYQKKVTLRALFVFSLVAVFALLEVIIFSQSNFRQTADFVVIGLGVILTVVFIGYVQFSLRNYKGSLERHVYERLAYTDQLTGAMNRFAYFKDVHDFKSTTDAIKLQLVYFDLDKLKDINDKFGHAVGDEAIRHAYQIIKKTFGTRGQCYRMGGDEFVCIIKDFKDSSIDADLKLFNDQCLIFDQNTPYKFNVSVGVSIYDSNENVSIEEALIKSDHRMYEHKQSKQRAHSKL